MQLFVIISPTQARIISQWPPMRDDIFFTECRKLAGDKGNLVRMIVPAIEWTLNVVIVSAKKWKNILAASRDASQYVHVQSRQCEVIFSRDDKASISNNGVTVSHWIKGDPQVSATRVSYEYTAQYAATFGTGYGSRLRSTCLDSVNSYRDKRFSSRSHPSPLIHDADIASHQYYSSAKQRSCLLQMKLETILHNLTSDVSSVAARLNPHVMSVVSGLSTKLIATTGRTLYSFCNGLHVDSCDVMSKDWKNKIFVTEEGKILDWHRMYKKFPDCSFPTTCGYQHVWREESRSKQFSVRHHFVMPGMGLAVSLEDSICHHFMGGAFAHCTSLCVLEKHNHGNKLGTVSLRNTEDFFRVFAWGSAANIRTSLGNKGRERILGDHISRQGEYRKKNTTGVVEEQNGSEKPAHSSDATFTTSGEMFSPNSSSHMCQTHAGCNGYDGTLFHDVGTDSDVGNGRKGDEAVDAIPTGEERGHSEVDDSDDSSSCFLFEDSYYSDDTIDKKKRKGKSDSIEFVSCCLTFLVA